MAGGATQVKETKVEDLTSPVTLEGVALGPGDGIKVAIHWQDNQTAYGLRR